MDNASAGVQTLHNPHKTTRMAAKKQTTAAPATRKGDPLSIRIDPKVRYGLELLSRTQRRSVTGVAEWSILQAFHNEKITVEGGREIPFEHFLSWVWSVNEVDRLIKLYFHGPELLTFEEERMARVIVATPMLWNGKDRSIESFELDFALENWDTAKPVIAAAAERPVVTGLTEDDLKAAGLFIPF